MFSLSGLPSPCHRCWTRCASSCSKDLALWPTTQLAEACHAQGFAERKLHLLHDILSSCHKYHQQAKRRERLASIRPLQAGPLTPPDLFCFWSSSDNRTPVALLELKAPELPCPCQLALQARSVQRSTSWGALSKIGTAEQSSQAPQQRPEQQQHSRSLARRRDQLPSSCSLSISVEEHQQNGPLNAPSCSSPAQLLSDSGLGPDADAQAALGSSSSSAAADAASAASRQSRAQRRNLQSPASRKSKLHTHVPSAEKPCSVSEQDQAHCEAQPHRARPEGSPRALDPSRPKLPALQETCECCGLPAPTPAASLVSSPERCQPGTEHARLNARP